MGRLHVAVSVLPQKMIAQQIGGDLIDIQLIVKPGADPHTFDLTPKQLGDLKKADFYWSAAVSFEKGLISRLHEIYPNLKVIDAVHVASQLTSHDEEMHSHGEELDPHIWLSPQLNLAMANQLRGYLSDLDPSNAFAYDKNYQTYAVKIANLDQQIKDKLNKSHGRAFLVFHPAPGSFPSCSTATCRK